MIRKSVLAGIGVCLATSVGLAGCSGGDSDSDASGEQTSSSSSESAGQSGPEPDLDGLADVVAVVNDEEITKDEFTTAYEGQLQQSASQSQASGQEVDQDQLKKQVVEGMIGTELMVQEAERRGFDASKSDVEQRLEQTAQQYGMKSVEELMSAFDEQGVSEDAVRADMTDQVQIEQLLDDESGNAEPTEAELRALYRQAAAQQKSGGGKVPPFAKVRPQLVQQAKSEQQAQVAQEVVAKLRKKADVTINL